MCVRSRCRALSYGRFLAPFAVLLSCSASPGDEDVLDGRRALESARRIVSFGAHPPGSEAQRQVGDFIIESLQSSGLEVKTDDFDAETPNGTLAMRNIWGIVPGRTESVLILASHYDSKLFEEFEFVGANDGAASSGLVLELARVLARRPPREFTLWFVFFDGEEAIREWTETDSLYGSRRFVSQLRRERRLSSIGALILLDLIGGRGLSLEVDLNSTRWLRDLVWAKGREMGYGRIFNAHGTTAATDDHVPFARAGVPVVDLIDLEYPFWHQAGDTVDKLSADNLEIVGRVVLASLDDVEKYLMSLR